MTTATRNSKRREELSSRKTGSRRSPRRGRRAAATGPASRLESPGERRNRNGMGKRRSGTHKSQRHNSTKLAACARKTQKQIQRSKLITRQNINGQKNGWRKLFIRRERHTISWSIFLGTFCLLLWGDYVNNGPASCNVPLWYVSGADNAATYDWTFSFVAFWCKVVGYCQVSPPSENLGLALCMLKL